MKTITQCSKHNENAIASLGICTFFSLKSFRLSTNNDSHFQLFQDFVFKTYRPRTDVVMQEVDLTARVLFGLF